MNTAYLPYDFISETMPPFEISVEEAASLRFAAACFRAERAALSLVANAEQTVFGLERKLAVRSYASTCAKAAVSHLAEIGVVSDARYAALWVQSRLSMKADGPRKMLASLCNKGIDRKTAGKAIRDALDFETETIFLKRYIAKNRLEDANRRERRQMLKYEGFSAGVIDALEEEE